MGDQRGTLEDLPQGATDTPPLRSSSAACHSIKGSGTTTINGKTVKWGPKDTISAPVFAEISHKAGEDAFLIRFHDRPLQERIGYHEERAR
jgi:gentisate 1,2-dioxygenase